MEQDTDNRADNRSNVFLTAVLVGGDEPLPVRVRNLSPGGAFLDGDELPAEGSSVRLVRGSLDAAGEVAWRDSGHAGLRFTAPIDVGAWVKRVGHGGQRRVDRAFQALRNQQPVAARPDAPSLDWISAELDDICARLAGSPALSLEVGEQLIRLDALAGTLRIIARSA